jgi:hypothetical protein
MRIALRVVSNSLHLPAVGGRGMRTPKAGAQTLNQPTGLADPALARMRPAHTFRHIFQPQTATTDDRRPLVKERGSRCDAMVSTANCNCPQLGSPNQRVGGSIPSRRT